jgi:hypothetical protein
VEASGEVSFRVAGWGNWTTALTWSTIHATNLRPDANRQAVVRRFYGAKAAGDAPLELRGSVDDVPFGTMPGQQGVIAPRYVSRNGRWWGEYEALWQGRTSRVDPNDLVRSMATTYQFLRAFDPFLRQALRGGVRLREDGRASLFGAVENLANRLCFLTAPAASPVAGRSLVFGVELAVKIW